MELNSMKLEELEKFFKNMGEKTFRAKQLFTFFHKNKRVDIENSNLSKSAIDSTKGEKIGRLKIFKVFDSKIDETKKLLYELEDKNLIEGVLMKYNHGYALCISTQVGCRMGCSFCASTKQGLVKNLRPFEMLMQVYETEKYFNIKINNFILMGSGEPLDNFTNVIRFVEILHSENGHNTSYRNITISTCGVADKIIDLADLKIPINLAISLHETNDKDRMKLMPINKKYNIKNLMDSLRYYIDKTNNRVTFEYTLIKNKNDSMKNIKELREITRGIKCHINLIGLNPIEEYDEKKPSKIEMEKFKSLLEKESFNVTIRRELGNDISASCGQLRRSVLR